MSIVKIVIQCAAKKNPDAGYLIDRRGKPVMFVADPDQGPPSTTHVYAHPDDPSEDGESWRAHLIEYNRHPETNTLNLSSAADLYSNPSYQLLADQYGLDNMFILSAGWGLIEARFLTPKYDITFSPSAEHYKRRRKKDCYLDLQMLPTDSDDNLVFFGGKDYLPLFCALSQAYRGERFVFYNSAVEPSTPGCTLIRYQTTTRTNWHYGCAKDFVAGKIRV
jgi:hypothetical protein